MTVFSEYTFPSSDGKHQIHVCRWMPEGETKAVLQIAHGVAEYAKRYDAFARFLTEHGFTVVANDHLGHGESVADESELGWFAEKDGWTLVVDDMKKLHDLTAAGFPGKPYFLLGHSMGSFLTRSYLIRYPDDLTGCIISGTGTTPNLICSIASMMAGSEIKKHGSKYKSEKLDKMAFGKYNDGFDTHRTKVDWLSRDPEVVDRYIADPLCGFMSSAGLFRDMMGGVKFNQSPANLARMNKDLPVYFMSGACDPVGSNGTGVQKAYEAFLKAGMKNVSIKLYPGGRHEMLNETCKEEVYLDVLAWLEGKIR